jgi:hypothetical protein
VLERVNHHNHENHGDSHQREDHSS